MTVIKLCNKIFAVLYEIVDNIDQNIFNLDRIVIMKQNAQKIHSLYYLLMGVVLASCNGGSVITPNPTPTPSPVPPLVCTWHQVGDASTFFQNLYNFPMSSTSPMMLSPDHKTLYVGGTINYTSLISGLGVAKINLANDAALWEPVADSQDGLAQLKQLTSLGMSSDGHVIYAAGQNTYGDGEPVVYSSTDNGNWTPVADMYSNLSLYQNTILAYSVTSLVVNGNTLYASISASDGSKSMVAQSTNGSDWTYVGDANAFLNQYLYTMTYSDGTLYVAGESAGYPTVYALNVDAWSNISPPQNVGGAIDSLSISGGVIYAAGYQDIGGLIYSVPAILPINPSAWSIISGNSFSGAISSISAVNNKIYAGGRFDGSIKSSPASSVNWTAISDESGILESNVSNMLVLSESSIYADGEFADQVVQYSCH